MSRGFNVAVSWPITAENHRIFEDAIRRTGVSFFTFTLLPQQDVCLTNRGTRELKPSEIERIKQMYRRYSERNPVGDVINNSEQTPDETVEEILRRIAADRWPEKHRT